MKKKRISFFLIVCCLLLVFSFSACDQEDENYSDETYYDGEEYPDDEQEQYNAQEENLEQEPLTYNDEPSDQGEGDGYWWGYDYEDEFYGDESADIISKDNTNIDWPSVQAVSSHQEAAQYFKECMDARMTTIPVRLTDGYDISIKDFLVITSAPYVSENIYSNDGDETCLTYDILYFPGTRIADAYLSKDTSGLNSDELQVYNIALQIVQEAEQMPSEIHKELILHDRICEAVKYYDGSSEENLPRHCTALGVFLDGEANCQGYADAFYMLGTMAGFQVEKQTGFTDKTQHVWNLIQHGTKWYAVDLTWNDDTFAMNDVDFITYKYFNVGADIMQYTHSWDTDSSVYQTASQTDGMYFYFTKEADDKWFGQHTDDINTIVTYSAQRLMAGDPIVYIMGKGFTADVNDVSQAIGKVLSANGYSGSFSVNIQTLGNHCYVYVDAAKRN